MTNEEATRIVKSEMCKNCGVYLGGGECDKDCRVIQCIEALSNKEKEDTVPFDFELYQAGLMDMLKEMIEVLDKIRAEIEQYRRETQDIDLYDLVGDCLAIFDKYMPESEKV